MNQKTGIRTCSLVIFCLFVFFLYVCLFHEAEYWYIIELVSYPGLGLYALCIFRT